MRIFCFEILLKNILICTILSSVTFCSIAQQKNPDQTASSQSDHSIDTSQRITYQLFNTADNRYGYDIFIEKTLFIHQPVIPCIAGKKGFKSKTEAKKVAILVIDKIRRGMIPPAITISEMQKLAIDLR